MYFYLFVGPDSLTSGITVTGLASLYFIVRQKAYLCFTIILLYITRNLICSNLFVARDIPYLLA